MNKKSILLAIFSLLLMSIQVKSQVRCGFDENKKKEIQRNPNYLKNIEEVDAKIHDYIKTRGMSRSVNDTFYIPCVVHIMHNGGTLGAYDNPTDAAVLSTIDYLNKVYNGTWSGAGGSILGVGDINIKFVLATKDTNNVTTTGIERVNCSGIADYGTYGMRLDGANGVDEVTIKNLTRWDPFKYYNIWVVNKIDGCGGVPNACSSWTAGFAYFPFEPVTSTSLSTSTARDRDGTIMLATGMTPGNVVLPHEIGHALSLYHPFEGIDANNACPSTDPTLGDKCADTDPINNPQGAGNAYPAYARDSFPYTSPFTNICTGTPYASTTEKNIMNYTFKTRLFTPNQKDRMKASCMTTIREGLTTSWANNRGTYPTTWVAPTAASVIPVTSSTGLGSNLGGIYRVELNDMIVNSMITSQDGGYVNRANRWYDLFAVTAGTSNTIKVNLMNSNNNQLGIYIDYNNDGAFNETTERIYINTSILKADGVGYTIQKSVTFTVPTAANMSVGSIVRMRIINDLSTSYGIAAVSGTSASLTYGQAEDYPIYLAAGTCVAPSAPSASGVSICSGNTASLSATGAGTLKWYSASTGGTLLATASTYTTPTLTSNTTYYVQDSTCAISATRTAVLVTVNALPTATITASTATTFCSGGSVLLTASAGSSFLWSTGATTQAITATTANSYTVKVTNANGCQSTSSAATVVTVNQSLRDTTVATSCGMYIWETGNLSDYMSSGTYSYTSNCQTHVLILTVNQPTSDTTVATGCDMYIWETGNLSDYFTTGTYSYTEGCVTHVLQLTMNQSVSDTLIVTETGFYTWQLNGNDYWSSGTYTSTTGCLTHVLILTILQNGADTTFATSCGMYVWGISGMDYFTAGTYSYSSGTLNYVLVLTINQPTQEFTFDFACGMYVWPINGSDYFSSGTYSYTLDCVEYILYLTVSEPTPVTTVATACGMYIWESGNYSDYFTSGTYSYTEGCITHILELTMVESISDTTVATSCGMYIWENGNLSDYMSSGTYSYTEGCVTHVLELTVNEPTYDTTVATACGMYIWESGNYSDYFTSGTYSYTENCVTHVLELTMNEPTSDTTVATSCGMYIWENGNLSDYFTSGTYSYTEGCITHVLELTMNEPTSDTTVATSCGMYIWETGSLSDYMSSGTYSYTEGCVTHVLQLTVSQPTTDTTRASICDGGMYIWETGNHSDYMSSGTYSYTENCVTHVLVLTNGQPTSSTTNAAACSSSLPYYWNGGTYSVAGTYVRTITNAAGCDSVATLVLTINTLTPGAPAGITQTLVSNICGQRVYRYTVTTAVANAYGYAWTLPASVGGVSGATVDSGDATSSRTIRVMYASNKAAIIGDSIRVRAWSGCGNSATKGFKLSNAALGVPVAPATLLITAVASNVCGVKVYRYAAPTITQLLATGTALLAPVTGYVWSFTGLGANAVIDSGDVHSQVIVVSYTSLSAAATGDSVRVAYSSLCGNSLNKAAKLTNVVSTAPLIPGSIAITAITTNVCGNRVYRYAAPNLPAATAKAAPATGYVWSFKGALGDNAVIDSGDVNSQKIVMHYTMNSAAGVGDSVKLYYTSSCGNSPVKASKLSNAAITAPIAPTAITITAVTPSVCGAKVYRYAAPATLPVATATATAATGWLWSFTNTTLGNNAHIDSGDVDSKVIVVSYTSNLAGGVGDSVRLRYTSACGNGANAKAKLTNVATAVPVAPTSLTITAIETNVCGARKYRYAAPSTVPAATATLAAPTGWLWSFTGTLGNNAFIDSGDVNSQVITVTFTSNAGAGTGDSVRVSYTSSCGNSLKKTAKLSNALLAAPIPASITMALVSDVCGARVYRYTAPATTSASATAPATTGWLWTLPAGPVGSTGTLDSGNVNSHVIKVRYTSNAVAGAGDTIKVAYTSACGTGANKAAKLSNVAKTGCPIITNNIPVSKAPVTTPAESMSVKVFPNPTTSNFNLQVLTAGKEEVTARVLDIQGRFIQSVKVAPNQTLSLGSALKAGAYFIEVRQGKDVKTTRVMKY